ncbi:hypothetical protein EVG20_g10285 [Dentipellis fragilis]|uniref:Uncharacterized protein n=1 Tax=Dentipellis fragilis TaxID=205917 RepID=A0A4Y9XSE9_9AGAM|nr:hypothetical protein EVG20_g10285 [Dentipellis fragilis]
MPSILPAPSLWPSACHLVPIPTVSPLHMPSPVHALPLARTCVSRPCTLHLTHVPSISPAPLRVHLRPCAHIAAHACLCLHIRLLANLHTPWRMPPHTATADMPTRTYDAHATTSTQLPPPMHPPHI